MISLFSSKTCFLKRKIFHVGYLAAWLPFCGSLHWVHLCFSVFWGVSLNAFPSIMNYGTMLNFYHFALTSNYASFLCKFLVMGNGKSFFKGHVCLHRIERNSCLKWWKWRSNMNIKKWALNNLSFYKKLNQGKKEDGKWKPSHIPGNINPRQVEVPSTWLPRILHTSSL